MSALIGLALDNERRKFSIVFQRVFKLLSVSPLLMTRSLRSADQLPLSSEDALTALSLSELGRNARL
jgi:hypothetical protein